MGQAMEATLLVQRSAKPLSSRVERADASAVVARPAPAADLNGGSAAIFGRNFRLTAEVVPKPVQGPDVLVSSVENALEPALVRAYRLQLARAARRAKVAQPEAGDHGVVVLKIERTSGDGLPEVSLDQGSGISALDTYAIEVIKKAVNEGGLPGNLSESGFVIFLPVHFNVD